MAIYHLSMKPIARSSGRSAVAAAAYRAGERLVNERDGMVHDFRAKGGVEHSEIVLPDGVEADWALDRSVLWNAAEFAEKRKDARVAREFEVALPHELTADERLDLTGDFAQTLADRFNVAVDFAIHSPDDDTDVRNHHAHILITTREVTNEGLGDKTTLERENRWLIENGLPTSQQQLRDIRLEWEELANTHLARAGHEIRIDHRSHSDRGLEIAPTQHMGVHATQMERRGVEVDRQRIPDKTARNNAERIRQNPELVLDILTDEKSVFDKRDIARTLHRYVNDDPAEYHSLLTQVMGSDELVRLTKGDDKTPAKYSTREMVEIETGMAQAAEAMADHHSHRVEASYVKGAVNTQDRALITARLNEMKAEILETKMPREAIINRLQGSGLSHEQREAIRHVTDGQQISVVVGYAGAGKSTLLAAAKEAWQRQGYTVHGAALAGKAAEGLEESSGIAARTLASWEYGWANGRGHLSQKDILVIDEAGMIGSKQMARFIDHVEQAGAKVVLVGDHEQLQAIGAGAAFRSIAETVGFAELTEVRRQRTNWQRDASKSFASHRTAEALDAYIDHGAVELHTDRDLARQHLVDDYVADLESNPDGSRLAMAHRKVDVRALNADIRQALKDRGRLAGDASKVGREVGAVERIYETNDGDRAFTHGDRLIFLQNNRDMGVKNGMLGTVEDTGPNRLSVRLDNGKGVVDIDTSVYTAFDHGYATTIHKTQGATVDRAYVMASKSMDRHLTYVSMTRHRHEARLYAGIDEFADTTAVKTRLSRSGAKETTLDYAQVQYDGFAARRGMAREPLTPEQMLNDFFPNDPDRQAQFRAAMEGFAQMHQEGVEAQKRTGVYPQVYRRQADEHLDRMEALRPGATDIVRNTVARVGPEKDRDRDRRMER